MAVIPGSIDRVVPQGRRSVVRVNPNIQADAEIEAAGMRGRGLQQIASGLSAQAEATQRAADSADENAYLDAKTKFLTAKVNQDSAYDKDPEWATYEKRYGENLGKVRSELGQTIKSPKYRAAFERETGLSLADGLSGIKSKAWDREVTSGVENLNNSVTESVSSALKARDESTRTTILTSINARIDAAVRAGYVSEPASKELKRKTAAAYAKQSIELLPYTEQLAALIPGASAPKITQTALSAAGDYRARVAQIESGGNNKAVNPKSGAFGKYQWMPKTAAQYGVTPQSSDKEHDAAFEKFTNDNRVALRAALSREPTNAELYLAHQQGAGGASALISNPDQPAIVTLTSVYGNVDDARAAILNNGGTEGMTSGQFVSLWTNRYNGGNGDIIGQALTGEVPPGGWDFSQPTGSVADILEPTVRADMIAAATKGMKDESKAAREAAQIAVSLGANDASQNAFLTGEADPTWEAKIMAAYPDERGAKLVSEYRRSAQAGADNNLIKNQSVQEDMAMLVGAEQAAMQAGPGSFEAAQRYGQLVTAVKQKHEQLTKDPAGYVVKNDPGASDAFDQIKNIDPKDPEGIMKARLAAETILASQRNLGLSDQEAKILPNDTATSIAAMIEPKEGQSGEEAVANIQAQAEQWGPYWPKVWSEIAGNVGDAGRMVAIMAPSQNIAAARLIEANQQKDVLEKQTQGEVGTKIKESVTDQFADFMETFAHSNATGEGLRYQQQAENLTRLYVVGGADPESAAARAYQETIGSVYDVTAGVRIPLKYDAEDVVSGAEEAARTLSGIDPVADDLGAGEDTQSQYLSSIKANHRWVNSSDGMGLSLLDEHDRPVLKNGQPFTLSFDELSKAKPMRLGPRAIGQQRGNVKDYSINSYNGSEDFGGTIRDPDGTVRPISSFDIDRALADGIFEGKGYESAEALGINKRDFVATQMYANKSALVSLGFDPSVIRAHAQELNGNPDLLGQFDPSTDRVRVQKTRGKTTEGGRPASGTGFNPTVAAHESLHRGIETVLSAYLGKNYLGGGPETPPWADKSVLTEDERAAVHKMSVLDNIDGTNEIITRILMDQISGIGISKEERDMLGRLSYEATGDENAFDSAAIQKMAKNLESAAAKLVAQRRKSGPR